MALFVLRFKFILIHTAVLNTAHMRIARVTQTQLKAWIHIIASAWVSNVGLPDKGLWPESKVLSCVENVASFCCFKINEVFLKLQGICHWNTELLSIWTQFVYMDDMIQALKRETKSPKSQFLEINFLVTLLQGPARRSSCAHASPASKTISGYEQPARVGTKYAGTTRTRPINIQIDTPVQKMYVRKCEGEISFVKIFSPTCAMFMTVDT